jgi:hypothetical protein
MHMPKYGPKAQEKIEKTMTEFKHGNLTDSHGNKVDKRDHAVAIGLDEARRSGAKVPKK